MSRKTFSPARRRGVAGFTAAVTLGALFVGNSNAAGPVIEIAAATIAAPVPTATVKTIAAAGPYNGTGTAVTITGTNFPATPTVSFGAVAASAVMRLSDKLIVAKAPSITAANTDTKVAIKVGDTVTGDTGSAEVSKADLFTYKAAPVLTDAKYSTDKKSLEITGSNLVDVSTLQLGPVALKVKSTEAAAAKITVKVPSGLVKSKYEITATSPWGSGTLSSNWNVLPLAQKIVAATGTAGVASGDSLGGAFVRITGSSLAGVDHVAFGHAAATFVVSSDSEIYVKVPPMSATQTVTTNLAKVDVVVKNGTLAAAKPLKFEYRVAPIVTEVPATAATNTVVTIKGSNLVGAKLVLGTATSGAKSLSAASGSSATEAKFTTPRVASNGFVLGTPYNVVIVTKGGRLVTGRTLTIG